MEENTQTQNIKNNNLAIPGAIVLAGLIIAGAIFISNNKNTQVANKPQVQKTDATVPPVTPKDHILGNPNAKIVVVEYSDLQCPYCADFHSTMKQVMEKYGKKGEVAWVYRHYWAERKTQDGKIFHPLAGQAAEASECVAEIGGNDKFWAFTNDILADKNTQSQKLTGMSEIAGAIGVDVNAFDTCLSSDKYKSAVQNAYNEGGSIGVSGTPSSFLITKKGTYPIEGYLPFSDFDKIIETLLD